MVKSMAKIKITQTKSTIKRPVDQKLTIKALGLGRINKTVEVEATPQILGMVRKVNHLVSVTE
jgi:large subunit ribosomal protein L30